MHTRSFRYALSNWIYSERAPKLSTQQLYLPQKGMNVSFLECRPDRLKKSYAYCLRQYKPTHINAMTLFKLNVVRFRAMQRMSYLKSVVKIKIYLTSVRSKHNDKYLLSRLCKLVLNSSSFVKLQIASLYKYIFRSLRKNRHFFDLVMKLTDVRN